MIDGDSDWLVEGGGAGEAVGFEVADGGLAEEAAVFAVELAGAFVADFKGCAGGVEACGEDAEAGGVKAEAFLVLKGAHGGEGAEVVVEGGNAHLGEGGEVFDAEGFVVVGLEPGDGAGGAVALFAEGGDGAQVFAEGALEEAIDDFALHEGAEEGDVAGGVEEVEQAGAGGEHFDRGGADGHAARAEGGGCGEELLLHEDFADGGHVELDDEAEEGFCDRGLGNLADDG